MGQERRLDMTMIGSPLDFAISEIDRQTMRMVEQALHADRLLLAWQPVVLTKDTKKTIFHEGLIRVLMKPAAPSPRAISWRRWKCRNWAG